MLPKSTTLSGLLAKDGLYWLTDKAVPGFGVPVFLVDGKCYSMKLDKYLEPNGFTRTAEIKGPIIEGRMPTPT